MSATVPVPVCRYCGVRVRWVKREDGSNHPPLTMVGEATVIQGNIAYTDMVWVRHYCRDEDCVAWEAAKAQGKEQDRERRDQKDSEHILVAQSIKSRDLAYADALPRACPKCHAEPGEPCENLLKRSKGIAAETSWPHVERQIEPTKESL